MPQFLLQPSGIIGTPGVKSVVRDGILRGWLQYYGRYYRSALYPPMRQLDRSLARWAYRKYKKLRRHLRRATHGVARLSRRDPKLFAHWQMGVRCGSLAGAV
jgi:RNA-directed DNA polymerase